MTKTPRKIMTCKIPTSVGYTLAPPTGYLQNPVGLRRPPPGGAAAGAVEPGRGVWSARQLAGPANKNY
jgi:hypothetical protein